jgi:hypothetical protein
MPWHQKHTSQCPKPKGDSEIDRVPIINFLPQEKIIAVPEAYIAEQPQPVQNTTNLPNLIGDDEEESIAYVFCFGAFANKNSGIVYHDLTGSFPFMSYDGSVCFFILYHYESNAILGTPIKSLDDISIFKAYKKQFEYLIAKGFKPKLNVMDNQATKHI